MSVTFKETYIVVPCVATGLVTGLVGYSQNRTHVLGKSLSQIVDKFPCMKASLFLVSLILLTFWIRGDLI